MSESNLKKESLAAFRQDQASAIGHPHEGINNGLTKGFLGLAKRYVDGDCVMPCIHLRSRPDSVEFYAFVKALPFLFPEIDCHANSQRPTNLLIAEPGQLPKVPSRQNSAVLVDEMEGVNEPQILVPSVIRLEPLDHRSSVGGKLVYFFLNRNRYEVIRVLPEREVNTADTSLVEDGELAGELIQCRVQIEKRFPDQNVNDLWNISGELGANEIIPACWVGFSDNRIWVRLNKNVDLTSEILDLGLSPLDL